MIHINSYSKLRSLAKEEIYFQWILKKLNETLDHFNVNKNRDEIAEILLQISNSGVELNLNDERTRSLKTMVEYFESKM